MDNLDEQRILELLSRKVLTEAEQDELWKLMEPKREKPSNLSKEEVDELLSAMQQPDFQSLAKKRENQRLRHLKATWDVVKPQDANQEDVDNLLTELQPAAEKAMRMGPVRRKLSHLRNQFGRFVYDQKTKHRYNAAYKREKGRHGTLTPEETELLLNALKDAMENMDDGREM